MTGLSENTVSDWKIYLHTRLIEIDYPTSNIVPIYLQQLLLKNFLTYSKWFTYQRRPNGWTLSVHATLSARLTPLSISQHKLESLSSPPERTRTSVFSATRVTLGYPALLSTPYPYPTTLLSLLTFLPHRDEKIASFLLFTWCHRQYLTVFDRQ